MLGKLVFPREEWKLQEEAGDELGGRGDGKVTVKKDEW